MAKSRKTGSRGGKSASETSRWSVVATPEALHSAPLSSTTSTSASSSASANASSNATKTKRGRKVTQVQSSSSAGNTITREYLDSVTLSCDRRELEAFVHGQHEDNARRCRDRWVREAQKKSAAGGGGGKGGNGRSGTKRKKAAPTKPQPPPKPKAKAAVRWTVHLGDALCLSDPDAAPPAPSTVAQNAKALPPRAKEMEKRWYPYREPWGVVQVMAIYRDGHTNANSNGNGNGSGEDDNVKLEVRRLYRHTNLVGGVPGLLGDSLLNTDAANHEGEPTEEVLETVKVLRGVALDRIVGRAVLRDEVGRPFVTAGHLQSGISHGNNSHRRRHPLVVPTVHFLCHRFYASGEEQIMPLLHASTYALERSLGRSELIRNDAKLQITLRWKYKLHLRWNGGGGTASASSASDSAAACIVSSIAADSATVRLPPPLLSLTHLDDGSPLVSTSSSTETARKFHDSARLPIDWSVFQYGRDIVCGGSSGSGGSVAAMVRRWTARVGDVVAVRADDARPPKLSEWVQAKQGNAWYPFNSATKWRPCRIAAIYTEDTASSSSSSSTTWTDVSDTTKVKFELQLLYRTADVAASKLAGARGSRHKNMDDEAYDVDLVEMDTTIGADGASLLGPVAIAEKEMTPLSEWSTPQTISGPCRLPVAYLRCCKQFDEQVKPIIDSLSARLMDTSTYYSRSKSLGDAIMAVLNSEFPHDAAEWKIEIEADNVARGPPFEDEDYGETDDDDEDKSISSAKQAPKRQKKAKASEKKLEKVDNTACDVRKDSDVDSLEEQVPDDDESSDDEMDDVEQAWTTSPPFHVDVASSRSYYTEIHIHPPYDHYAAQFREPSREGSGDNVWTVKIGDTVAVHFDVGGNVGNGPKLPFTATWCPAEVVCMWKQHRFKEDVTILKDEAPCGSSDDDATSGRYEMRMEVRWLYRQHEMPGSARQTFSAAKTGGLEEVIETDDTLDCPAAALLAPVKLYASSVPCDVPTVDVVGMPIMSYQCHRFWSIHRKSLMPSGSIKGRVERGRMYSSYFGKDALLKAALDKILGGAGNESAAKLSSAAGKVSSKAELKSNFRDAISRLSLSDASADAQIRGMELTGRKKELNQIKDFLRSAIQGAKNEFKALDGTEIESSVKSSIFIAGPPGTGKTACVKAVIAQLRHEQASGDIPQFDFVSLNGMEMQYPFDAYVRLWEAISEFKEKRTPGVAAAMLERHFVGSSSKKSVGTKEGTKRPVTVVLLDEIDYLVTNKQSVLYNFFEWPRRSATNISGARLVVIGISNTINLPERLKPAVQSRLGRERCVFKAYNVEETCNILKARLSGSDDAKDVTSTFDQDALTFAARKTAVMSGDIRKAFQICKAAAETVLSKMEEEGEPSQSHASRNKSGGGGNSKSAPKIVRIPDIQRAARDMFNSIINRAVSSATSFEALLIVSIASLQKHTGREKGGFDVQEILTKMKGVAESLGDRQYLPPPSFGELLGILNRLGEARVITLQTPKGLHASYHASLGGGGGAWPLVSLRMEDYEVEAALRDTPHKTLAEKHLADKGLFGF